MYQEYLAKSLTEKYSTLSSQLDNIIHDANAEINKLRENMSGETSIRQFDASANIKKLPRATTKHFKGPMKSYGRNIRGRTGSIKKLRPHIKACVNVKASTNQLVMDKNNQIVSCITLLTSQLVRITPRRESSLICQAIRALTPRNDCIHDKEAAARETRPVPELATPNYTLLEEVKLGLEIVSQHWTYLHQVQV